uniref:Uncharacterized protein n=1 Tax=Medicago truncatula TaxID=3880 RepID=I3S0I4_MEDTR|nr:unknown [Medicago truncatula]
MLFVEVIERDTIFPFINLWISSFTLHPSFHWSSFSF